MANVVQQLSNGLRIIIKTLALGNLSVSVLKDLRAHPIKRRISAENLYSLAKADFIFLIIIKSALFFSRFSL